MHKTKNDILLELKNISKEFPGVKALDDVSLNLREGEVLSLVGENGAGKSTLMKILSGVYKKDKGEIIFNGAITEILSPRDAQEKGISIIYQELNLMSNLTVAENIYIGRPPTKNGIINWNALFKSAQKLLDDYGIPINAHNDLRDLSIAQQQMVEIAKAISYDIKIVIMDEPTSSLTIQEKDILFSIIRNLTSNNIAVVFISHRMDELFDISDRMAVMRDGKMIGIYNADELTREDLISKMIGRKLTQQFPKRDSNIKDVMLKVEGLGDGKKVKDVNFYAKKGEVVGFAGLVGSGRTEVMRLIFGADKKTTGSVIINDKPLKRLSPIDSIKNKIGFVTEDRKQEGLFLSYNLKFNTTIVAPNKIKTRKLISAKKETLATKEFVDKLKVATPSENQLVVKLSGGNQQKIVLAKWLFSDSEIIIMDEPTRGIDVGAKYEIYELINKLSSQGKAILVVSSEMEEILGISDRIYVMREGRIAGEVLKSEFSQEALSKYAIGDGAIN